jgi:hypothetical protein
MNAGPVTPAVQKWAERGRPGAQVTGYTLRPLEGGAVARSVDQVTLHLTGGYAPLELVRKQAFAHEIAGLRAAQPLRAQTAAVPELVAWGSDWLMTPLAPGTPLAWGDPAPAALFDALAALHARYLGAAGLPAVIPRVTPAWWQSLGREWVEPQLREHAGRHPAQTAARARALVDRAAGHPGAAAVLASLPPTLLHGDVHPGNVLVHSDQVTLIDWGNSRVGPAALDLANLVPAGSPEVARYTGTWQRLTGQPLPAAALEPGYRWAALQIPVQYLPWTIAHRSTRDTEAALDRIEQALADLPS